VRRFSFSTAIPKIPFSNSNVRRSLPAYNPTGFGGTALLSLPVEQEIEEIKLVRQIVEATAPLILDSLANCLNYLLLG
jgi:hypothetical protein